MSNFMKQPSIKLIPSDPMTNTILIIYCVSSTGASVPYRSTWRKVNPRNGTVEQVRSNNGSSYRCSPLDVDCLIEATVYFQHQNLQLSRVVQSNLVKVSRQLKDRKLHIREPILCRIALDQIVLESKIIVQDGALNILLAGTTSNSSFKLPINDISIELDGSHLVFRVIFKEKMQAFLEFVTQLLGWKPQTTTNFITLTFGSDINRDIVLLGIAEYPQKAETGELQNASNDRYEQRQREEQGGHNKNKSQSSFSPSGAYKEKFKLAGKLVEMKRSFNNLQNGSQKRPQPKMESKFQSKAEHRLQTKEKAELRLQTKEKAELRLQTKEKAKQRQFLNIFQEDELQLLGPPRAVSFDVAARPRLPKPEPPLPGDQPSMNLRGSFEQLQRSFNGNLNEQAVDRVFRNDSAQQTKKLQQDMSRLQKQNQLLKKQLQSANTLTKQNNTLKRKYQEMKEEISRLQMERKVILTDKLRCEVNWHKEIQQKEQLKKELEHLREAAKANPVQPPNYPHDRTTRTHSIHEVPPYDRKTQNRENNPASRDLNRSPNSSLYR